MASDQKLQTLKGWLAKLNQKQNKIQIEINDGVTYVGQLPVMPGMNVKKLIDKIQKGDAQIITKTTNKMCIQLGFITITLNNAQNVEMLKLKSRIQELQKKLQKINTWQEQDLNSTLPFDINSQYMIKLNNGSYTCKCVYVINNQIGYTYTGGTYYYTQNNNRRNSTTGHQVTGIWKKKAL